MGMGYLEYLRSSLGPFVPFLFAMAAVLALRSGEVWAAIGATWLAALFFGFVFSMLWLLGAIVGRKPRRQLTRLR